MSTTYRISREDHAKLTAEIAQREAELAEAEALIARVDAEIETRDPLSDDQTPFRNRRTHAKAAAYARDRIAAVTTFLASCTVEPEPEPPAPAVDLFGQLERARTDMSAFHAAMDDTDPAAWQELYRYGDLIGTIRSRIVLAAGVA